MTNPPSDYAHRALKMDIERLPTQRTVSEPNVNRKEFKLALSSHPYQ